MDRETLKLVEVPNHPRWRKRLYEMLDIDFPVFARIPLGMLSASLESGRLQAVFLTDGKVLLGYAIFQWERELDVLHVLYIAILPDYRSMGLGSVMLEMLGEASNGRVLLDVEDPTKAKKDADRREKEKRISFYERGGFHLLEGFRFSNFGFQMRVMANFEPPRVYWLPYYRKLYDNAYGHGISWFMIKPER